MSLLSDGTPQPSHTGEQLARDMIEVHGADAARVARDNARAAARAAQFLEARKWLRVVELIQRLVRPVNTDATASVYRA